MLNKPRIASDKNIPTFENVTAVFPLTEAHRQSKACGVMVARRNIFHPKDGREIIFVPSVREELEQMWHLLQV
jgi:hypothetical protein